MREKRSGNILIVDDEVHNLSALERTFRREYNVFLATGGEDALSIMKQTDITLIITDHRMPGMTGVEFLEKTLREYPDTIRIILTGYADDKTVIDAINMGHIHNCLHKPWQPEEIRAIVRKSIQEHTAD